ncbi:MAG TPA: RNA methyltransferase [bacterium]|nr:RNA methyltransferase [bacterium]HMY37202.1 RNA methyltransferase [bacterium]HNB08407.1 RNA methyltransferase [bacterium]HNB57101.1 RNA methyltransferase [bacterium]HNC50244.1 RNA methyltransferase [bacterium]
MTPQKDFVYPDLTSIAVILVEPQAPGNIGSVARAMKNFGMKDLRLVRPCDHLDREALWMAVKAEDILHSAQIYSTLTDALKGIQFSVATSNRRRETHFPSFTPREIAQQMAAFSPITSCALVFGGEKNGLSTEDVHACRVLSTVTTAPVQNSLNLSHAVMIYLYEVFAARLTGNPQFVWDMAKPADTEILYERIQRVLEAVKFKPRKTNEGFLLGVRRILGRTPLEDRDVRLLHKIFQEIERYVKRSEA